MSYMGREDSRSASSYAQADLGSLPIYRIISLDKMLFSVKDIDFFSYFSTNTYVVGTH